MEANHPLAPGQQVGPYEILSQIGQGGMGVVYKALDTRLGRHVALKCLSLHFSGDQSAKDRFLLEARAASLLNHPNICTVYDIGETEQGQLFIAMAYYEGETLAQHIGRGPLPLADALNIIIQLTNGIGAAHAQNIYHRDIKPANILVTPDWQVRILDFGVAKIANDHLPQLTQTGMGVGTVTYSSPEQLLGRMVDQRTDIWAIGVVLYEMLSGRVPFGGENSFGIMQAIMHEDPIPICTLRPDLPPAMDNILGLALQRDCSERYQTLERLRAELMDINKALPSVPAAQSQWRPLDPTRIIAPPKDSDAAPKQAKPAASRSIGSGRKLSAMIGVGLLALGAIGAIIVISRQGAESLSQPPLSASSGTVAVVPDVSNTAAARAPVSGTPATEANDVAAPEPNGDSTRPGAAETIPAPARVSAVSSTVTTPADPVEPTQDVGREDAAGNGAQVATAAEVIDAARQGNLDALTAMLSSPLDLNTLDEEGWTALTHASWHGHGAVVTALIRAGADPNAGLTLPLVVATVKGYQDIMQSLLVAGANPNAKEADGVPVLMLAVASEYPHRVEMAKKLLTAGADPQSSAMGTTALDIAQQRNDQALIRLLR